ncbi:MAG: hypothetical protein Ct9H300mP1_36830 [Planctomycetaceae bacterium]|nr:MAG: hypothetical protein Ct9H300mP1_36830 [Planctomycetaceae bacterium]
MTRSSGRVLAVRDGKWKYIPQLGRAASRSRDDANREMVNLPSSCMTSQTISVNGRTGPGDRLDVLKRIRTVARRLTGATGP